MDVLNRLLGRAREHGVLSSNQLDTRQSNFSEYMYADDVIIFTAPTVSEA
jgi:hypothetical protein